MGIEWIPPTAASTRRAVEIARQFAVTVYDAVFAAVAENVEAVFVTADERLARRLAALPVVRYLGDVEADEKPLILKRSELTRRSENTENGVLGIPTAKAHQVKGNCRASEL